MPIETFTIAVVPSPETNDHEVRLRADDTDLIERFAGGYIGLDPDDILTQRTQLLAGGDGEGGSEALIARCDCGVIGCGSLSVRIARAGSQVTWRSLQGSTTVSFAAAQYLAEVQRALADFSWEPPDRTAGRKIMAAIDRDLLQARGFTPEWASGRVTAGQMVLSLRPQRGPPQVLVRVPWDGSSSDLVVQDVLRVLSRPPSQWPT